MIRRRTSVGAIQPVAVGGLVLVLAVAGFVLWPVLTAFDLPFLQVQASIQPQATIDGQTVHVTATTDLPDGAVVYCYLSNEAGELSQPTNATVVSGAFAFDTALPWTTGTAELDCIFGTAWAVQPANVLDTFGKEGERMAGPQVFRASPGTPKELFASVSLGPVDGSPPAPGPSAVS